jgi:predicted GIY-YIG superfamily endonuclease
MKKRCIYAAEFIDEFVYVGLTYNFKKRTARHLVDIKSQVYKHIQKYQHNPKFKQLTEYSNIETAQQNEKYYVDYYRNKGWKILNIAKTGAIGGSRQKWTRKMCHIEALKYGTKSEFQKKSCGAYTAAYRNKWLEEVSSHMSRTNYWYDKKSRKILINI